MMASLHDRNLHMVISVWAKFGAETAVDREMVAEGLVLKSTANTGEPGETKERENWVDMFDPRARKAFWSDLNHGLFNFSIDGWWLDASHDASASPCLPPRPAPPGHRRRNSVWRFIVDQSRLGAGCPGTTSHPSRRPELDRLQDRRDGPRWPDNPRRRAPGSNPHLCEVRQHPPYRACCPVDGGTGRQTRNQNLSRARRGFSPLSGFGRWIRIGAERKIYNPDSLG